MINTEEFEYIYLHRNPVDFRKGIIGLSAYVQANMELDPFSSALFLFTNKKRNSVKMLYWDKTGFALWHKVLDCEKFPWPRKVSLETIIITDQQLDWLLQGIDFFKLSPHKSSEKKYVI